MHRWTIGDVDVVRVEEVDFAMPVDEPMPAWCIPGLAPSTHEHRVAFSALAIADGDTRIVVDPWLQAQREQPDAEQTATQLLEALSDAGFDPDTVDVVVNSHLEGVGWNTRPIDGEWTLSFPNARYLYPADELDAVARGIPIPGGDDLRVLAELTDIESVSDERRISASVTVEPTSGHSEGHQMARIEQGGDLALYLGHLVIHPLQLHDPGEQADEYRSAEAAVERRRYLGELAERGGTLLTTLIGGPGGGRVREEGTGYALDLDA